MGLCRKTDNIQVTIGCNVVHLRRPYASVKKAAPGGQGAAIKNEAFLVAPSAYVGSVVVSQVPKHQAPPIQPMPVLE